MVDEVLVSPTVITRTTNQHLEPGGPDFLGDGRRRLGEAEAKAQGPSHCRGGARRGLLFGVGASPVADGERLCSVFVEPCQ